MTGADGAARWKPAGDDTIIFTFSDASSDEPTLYELRHEFSANLNDPKLAAQYATTALEDYGRTGDPRLLGYAKGALRLWHDAEAPPLDIWLLRGRLAQTEHRFAAAARDMDRLLARHPGNASALLIAADGWRRAGNLSAARGRCLQLSLAGRPSLARLCSADIQLSLGQGARALQAASSALADDAGLPAEARAWGYALRAEAATAANEIGIALDSWQQSLDAGPDPALALHLGYVDTLLAAGKYDQALARLDALPPADAVLLRRAIAGTVLRHDRLASWRAELERRFAAPAYTAADSLHWRERAMFELDVLNRPEQALAFAKRNWAVQKGFEDAELLLRAAVAAGDTSGVNAVTEWRSEQGGESS